MIALATLARNWRLLTYGIGAAAIVALYFAWQHEAGKADALAVSLRAEEAKNLALERRNTALEKAATERATQEREAADHDKEISDAIAKAAVPGTAPGPTAVVLGCDRLRRQGSTSSAEYRRLCR